VSLETRIVIQSAVAYPVLQRCSNPRWLSDDDDDDDDDDGCKFYQLLASDFLGIPVQKSV